MRADSARLTERHEVILVDTRPAFDNLLVEVHPMALANDRIHANLVGHMALARALLDAVGYTW
jgi:hypothetical protein